MHVDLLLYKIVFVFALVGGFLLWDHLKTIIRYNSAVRAMIVSPFFLLAAWVFANAP